MEAFKYFCFLKFGSELMFRYIAQVPTCVLFLLFVSIGVSFLEEARVAVLES